MVCALGHTLRNGTLEFALSFTIMILAVPWLKYFVNANTFVYDLKERFVQQISTSMQDMPIGGLPPPSPTPGLICIDPAYSPLCLKLISRPRAMMHSRP
jgi:hypothetical protein